MTARDLDGVEAHVVAILDRYRPELVDGTICASALLDRLFTRYRAEHS